MSFRLSGDSQQQAFEAYMSTSTQSVTAPRDVNFRQSISGHISPHLHQIEHDLPRKVPTDAVDVDMSFARDPEEETAGRQAMHRTAVKRLQSNST